jgi:hypothetical protein
MRYWKRPTNEIYWGDRISNADVAVSIQEGEEAYQRYLLNTKRITPLQGKAVLLKYSYINQVEDYVYHPDTNPLIRLAYESAEDWVRGSQFIWDIATLLNLSPEQVDVLFEEAKELEFI